MTILQNLVKTVLFIMAATGNRVLCAFVKNHRIVGLDINDPRKLPNELPQERSANRFFAFWQRGVVAIDRAAGGIDKRLHARFFRVPVKKLSTPTTAWFNFNRSATRCEPRKPAAPVTNQRRGYSVSFCCSCL